MVSTVHSFTWRMMGFFVLFSRAFCAGLKQPNQTSVNNHARSAPTQNSPWNNGNLVSIIRFLQECIQIPHDTLKWITHEVQRTIGKDYRIFSVFTKVTFRDDLIIQSIGRGGRRSKGSCGPTWGSSYEPFGRSSHQHGGVLVVDECRAFFRVVLTG